MLSIAFLAWVSTTEAKEYFANAKNKLINQKKEDIKRESWKRHPLYEESKENLVSKCIEGRLSFFFFLQSQLANNLRVTCCTGPLYLCKMEKN